MLRHCGASEVSKHAHSFAPGRCLAAARSWQAARRPCCTTQVSEHAHEHAHASHDRTDAHSARGIARGGCLQHSLPARARYTAPAAYDAAFAAARGALLDAFLGPPAAGVYSPSVQYTLFQMGRLLLERCGRPRARRRAPPQRHVQGLLPYAVGCSPLRAQWRPQQGGPADMPTPGGAVLCGHGPAHACPSRSARLRGSVPDAAGKSASAHNAVPPVNVSCPARQGGPGGLRLPEHAQPALPALQPGRQQGARAAPACRIEGVPSRCTDACVRTHELCSYVSRQTPQAWDRCLHWQPFCFMKELPL